MRTALLILPLLLLASCATPVAFAGRLILEGESHAQMLADPRCQSAWDLKPGQHASACSWTFPDGTNRGLPACHIVFEQPGGAYAITVELANCADIDLEVMDRNSGSNHAAGFTEDRKQ